MTKLIISALLAGVSAAILITATHLLLWRKPWRLKRTQAYLVGTAEIGLVLTIWALITNHPEAIIGFWAIAGCAGAADLTAWWFRRRLNIALNDAAIDGFERGRIVGLDADDDADADDDPSGGA